MKKHVLLLVLFFVSCGSLAQASSLQCVQIFNERETVDQALQGFLKEMESFAREVEAHRDTRIQSARIEWWKSRRGAHVRKTREERELKIHGWRMTIRTGDLQHVLEALRPLFNRVVGEARVLDRMRALHLELQSPEISRQMPVRERQQLMQRLEKDMDQAIEVLGAHYADYSAARWVLRELKDNGELTTRLREHGLTVQQFSKQLKDPEIQVDAQLVELYRRQETFNELYDLVVDRLPPNSLQRLQQPELFDVEILSQYNYVRTVFNGDSSRFAGRTIYRPDGPLRRTLEVDRLAERRAFWWSTFTNTYGRFMDALVWSIDMIPGGGYRVNPEAFRATLIGQSKIGEAFLQGVSDMSASGRAFFYLFTKAFINRRAQTEHLSDIEALRKIANHRSDSYFLTVVREKAARHGERNFFMTYSRLPFYHENFMHFKALLAAQIKEYQNQGTPSLSLETTMKNLQAAEARGSQLGPLSVTLRSHLAQELTQGAILSSGVALSVYEVGNFFISADPAGTSAVNVLFNMLP